MASWTTSIPELAGDRGARRPVPRLAGFGFAVLLALLPLRPSTAQAADTSFAGLVASLSEPGGFFFSDNLVSNETSYLHPVGVLERRVQGGVYLGVGPEQNFSYIAAIHPTRAFIIDIRRDNLLLQLLFKAAFELSRNRLEYLGYLYGRAVPANQTREPDGPLEAILARVDELPTDSAAIAPQEARLWDRILSFGVPLSADDRVTLTRFHLDFREQGLDIRFSSYGRRPFPIFPSNRDLYLARDRSGRQVSYLATADRFETVQRLERADAVVPLVGNLAGRGALPALADFLAARHLGVSAFYTSNVEFYLFRDGSFPAFVFNLAALPVRPGAVIIRSYFDRQTGQTHPQAVPGQFSVQLLEGIPDLIAAARSGRLPTYWDLVTVDALPIEP